MLCFFQLRQLRRSLDDEKLAVLVHAFITSRVNYSDRLLAGALKSTTEKLQRVMNAAARLITNTRKFDHDLTYMRCHVLHWLDVNDQIKFRLCVTVYKFVHGLAPG